MTLASLFTIILVLLVVGFVVYLVGLAPIDAAFKKIIQAIAIFAAVIWLLITFVKPLLHA